MTHPTETIVKDIHEAIEAWLSRGEGDLVNDLLAVMAPEFEMANPDGSTTKREDAANGLGPAKGAVPGITFEIRDYQVIAENDGLCVSTYIEAQQTPGGPNERRTLSVFKADPSAAHGYLMVRSQETWTVQP